MLEFWVFESFYLLYSKEHKQEAQCAQKGGALCFHYYCLSGHWGDVNQSLGPEKQKCSPENLVGITHSQITFFYSENPTKIGPKGTQLLTNFQKLQISLLRKWKTVYKKSCRGQKVSLGGLRPPTSNPTLKNLKFGTPWASYGCFGH